MRRPISGSAQFCAALCFVLLGDLSPANAKVVNANLTIDPFTVPTWDCGGGAFPAGARCWGTLGFQLPFEPVTVDTNDILRIRVDLADRSRLRWEEDGAGPVPVFGDEFASIVASSSTGSSGFQGTSTQGLSFRNVRGELLVNDMLWDSGFFAAGGVGAWTYIGSPFQNFTDSWFEFSSFEAEFQAQTCLFFCLPITVDQLSFVFGTGRFSVTEPGILPLLGLAFAGLVFSRRRKLH